MDTIQKFKRFHAELGIDATIIFHNLSGKIMGQLDASLADEKQREALKRIIKDIVWNTCNEIKERQGETTLQFSELFGVYIGTPKIVRKINFKETDNERK